MSKEDPPGPPWPDHDEDDVSESDEIIAVEDNYKRRNGQASIATALNDVLGDAVLDASKYTDAYWTERERQLANERARDAARTERDRMRKRAELLVHAEGESGSRCRFPKWAVDAAQNITIDTESIKNARQFLHAAQIASAAADARRLGERDDEPAPPEPHRILVLGGGTGTGKTTASAWLALKGDDAMPGFIRASELERRGRYDKDLKVWIPERTSLVIDDLGAELLDGKGVFRSFLDEIVDTFYSSKRRLIITTNLKPKIDDEYRADCARDHIEPEPQFRERYGDRVRSRVIQIGQWAECGNDDLRTGAKS